MCILRNLVISNCPSWNLELKILLSPLIFLLPWAIEPMNLLIHILHNSQTLKYFVHVVYINFSQIQINPTSVHLLFHTKLISCLLMPWQYRVKASGPWFNIKMTSYQYRKSHCGDKTILRPSYLHNGISYTGKTTSLYWIRTKQSRCWKVCLNNPCRKQKEIILSVRGGK